MPKRFKFRFSGVIPTFCRPSKRPSDLPSDPFLSFLHRLRHRPPSDLKWTQTDTYHVFAPDSTSTALPRRKIYNSAASDEELEKSDADPPDLRIPIPPTKSKHRRSRIRIRKRSNRSYGVRLSISSTESGLFSEDEEIGEETETLVSNSNSSRSFSTDSSTEFSPHLETIREGSEIRSKRPKKRRNFRRKVKIGGRRWPIEDEEEVVSARLSAVFRRIVPCTAGEGVVEGKVRESMAVVKRSEEPYADFRRSMAEMIVEKEMTEERDLKELLRCFLELNAEEHHGMIVRAFDEICGALFLSRSSSSCLVDGCMMN